MNKEETTYVRYKVQVSWKAVSYSENTNPTEGQQFSVVRRFKENVETALANYPIGQIDLYLLGSNADREDKKEKTEINYTYYYGVEAIIFDGEPDNAPAGEVFEDALERIADENKDIQVSQTENWKQQNPSVQI